MSQEFEPDIFISTQLTYFPFATSVTRQPVRRLAGENDTLLTFQSQQHQKRDPLILVSGENVSGESQLIDFILYGSGL